MRWPPWSPLFVPLPFAPEDALNRCRYISLKLPFYPSLPLVHLVYEELYEVDGKGEHDGGVLLRRYLDERLQVAKLKRHRFLESMSEASESLVEAWYSPSAPMIFALLSLSASACLEMARCISWGKSTFFTSTFETFIPHGSVWVSSISCSLSLIFSRFDRTPGRARSVRSSGRAGARCVEEVFHVNDGFQGIDYPEKDDGIYLDRHVVPRNDILRRDVEHDSPEAHLYHPVDHGDEEDESRPFRGSEYPTEPG